ncbi:hypothetical protein Pyrfu_1466 [Pyrolobus fumarii 1A]|uniref:Uncharacterized protein n=1 Tax=Pyrolobus fumarii (strain DSM 11204 / 1A) TaxID=694429 RepID=G0EHA0_PYRF1|nr:hypothetical protein [Pyrolobus fumarii]AEM39324.1 hypothetical protein Pyrfu_1466 [Pyrolobus fumarii 1A]
MKSRQVRLVRGFEITPAHLESLAMYHAAIDPDSGHLVCHGYSLQVVTLVVDGNPVPALLIDESLIYTSGSRNVELLVKASSKKVEHVTIDGNAIVADGIRLSNPWIFHAISMARDFKSAPTLYIITLKVDEDRESNALMLVYTKPEHHAFIALEYGRPREDKPPTLHV